MVINKFIFYRKLQIHDLASKTDNYCTYCPNFCGNRVDPNLRSIYVGKDDKDPRVNFTRSKAKEYRDLIC